MAPRKTKSQANRPRKKRTAQDNVGSRIDQAVKLQQRAIDRYAQLASTSVNRVVAGDFNLSTWMKDYSSVLGDCAGDLNDAAKILLQDRSSAAPGRNGRRRTGDWYRSWLTLQQSFLGRVANYYGGVGNLIAAGSMEPREWIEEGANLWRDVLADMADWTRRESGSPLRPTFEWMPRVRQEVKEGRLTAKAPITVPIEAFAEAFPGDPAADPKITLVTDGLSPVAGGAKLKVKENLEFFPPEVQRSKPYSELRLFDLPRLVTGSVYAGIVWAKETHCPVAAVEIHIV